MDNSVYSWKNRSGHCALCFDDAGANAFAFGHATKSGSVNKALKYASMGKGTIKANTIHDIKACPRWSAKAVSLLDSFFDGREVSFDMQLSTPHATSFQIAVWKATKLIPYGETRSYSWVAERAGSDGATRAAGSALGANPLPIIVPCHRVIRADGTLGGFGLGIDEKKRLLAIESKS